MYICILNYLTELKPWILRKISLGEFLTPGEYEFKTECQICYLQVSKGEMACTTINYLWCMYVLKIWNKEDC